LLDASQIAEHHTQRAQSGYASHYNLRAKHKRFEVGDQVILLAPEGGSKLCNRWVGPVTVVEVKSPHSYMIDMGDGNVRHIHANKICCSYFWVCCD